VPAASFVSVAPAGDWAIEVLQATIRQVISTVGAQLFLNGTEQQPHTEVFVSVELRIIGSEGHFGRLGFLG
jgi:hypothetical protein